MPDYFFEHKLLISIANFLKHEMFFFSLYFTKKMKTVKHSGKYFK
jgi:hypothetical protein